MAIEITPRNTAKSASHITSASTSETRKKREQPVLALVILLLFGALLFSPAVFAPLFLDDHLQASMVEGTWPAPRSPFDLYSFVDDGDRAALASRGLLPWWSDAHLTIRFFRPLASLLLYVDHRVLAHAALPMHLHSLAWWVLAVLAARALFRRVLPRRPASIATAIFALAPCHALPLAWVANRETLIALCFGSLALSAQVRFREDRTAGRALAASGLFALALFAGGEYALSFGGYVVAMELGRSSESLVRRVSAWLTFAAPAAAYLTLRGVLGYGAAASGFYSDPLHEPRAFLANAPWRGVALLATGWLGFDTESFRTGVWRSVLSAAVVLTALALVLPLRRLLAASSPRERRAVLWLLVGSLLALVPTLAVVPARRLLGVGTLGIAAVVAMLVDHAWFPREGEPRVARGLAGSLSAVTALGLGFVHFVHAPGISFLASELHRSDASDFAGRVAWVRARTGPPAEAHIGVVRGMAGVFFAPFALDPRGETPATWRVLSQAGHVLVLRRGPRTLDVVAGQGRGLYPIGERNLYRSTDAPLRKDDVIAAPGFQVTILETGPAGPRSARFEFDDDPDGLVWLSDAFEATRDVELPSEGFGAPFDP
ncbi:MAG: hypothetical protein JWP97_5167 [Labilithrix sp.]|nr:hypothetical protein [Labilithrix sp.]